VPTDAPPPPFAPEPRGGILVAIRNAILFLLALGATSSVLVSFTPFPSLGNLWRKEQHLKRHGQNYSLIYIGSSRVFHEFIPKDFDAALAAKGHQVRSFNFGQDGMWPPESLYMLRHILKERPPKLKWVLIDLMAIRRDVEGNETTKRAVYWHDWRHTWMACRHVVEVDIEGQRSVAEKVEACWRHLTLFAQQATGLGRGQEMLEVRLKLRQERRFDAVPKDGFEEGGKGPLRGAALARFNESVATLKKDSKPRIIQPVLREALDDIIAEVRAAGAEPIFVVASSIYGTERYRDWPPERVTVLRFDDPVIYPDLYDPANRYDLHHLDLVGAQRFTRHLAEQFADVLERKP
jgi:hypothetical protein